LFAVIDKTPSKKDKSQTLANQINDKQNEAIKAFSG
jgi:hypothetical protein